MLLFTCREVKSDKKRLCSSLPLFVAFSSSTEEVKKYSRFRYLYHLSNNSLEIIYEDTGPCGDR